MEAILGQIGTLEKFKKQKSFLFNFFDSCPRFKSIKTQKLGGGGGGAVCLVCYFHIRNEDKI